MPTGHMSTHELGKYDGDLAIQVSVQRTGFGLHVNAFYIVSLGTSLCMI